MSATLFPVLMSLDDPVLTQRHILDQYSADLAVGYAIGPPYGERMLTIDEFGRLDTTRRTLRRNAALLLEDMLDSARIHGQPPALMLSCHGFASSVVLADSFWDGLADAVPGDLVIGVPARDVVIITGSQSRTGVEKARRAVDRVFFAGGRHLILRDLLARRAGRWELYSGR